jgi:tocopherol O-methyltransferase
MTEFDAADVRRYYDRNTRDFVTHGQGGGVGAIHRPVWGPGTKIAAAAFRYVEDRIVALARDLQTGSDPLHVVDLGCGVGASLCSLAERLPLRGTGFTLSPVQVRHADQRIREAGLGDRVVCREGDFCQLPDDLAPADLAYAIESFVHGPDPARFFESCAGLVRAGGLLVVCDDVLRAGDTPAAQRTVRRFQRGWHLNTVITADALRRLASDAGFEHLSTEELTPHLHLGRPRDHLIAWFVALCGWLPLEHTRFGHLVGGNALRTCLSRGWIGYDLAVFRRR